MKLTHYQIMDSDVIFTLRKPYRIDSDGFFMRRDSAGSFYMKQKVSKRFFYRISGFDGYHDNVYVKSYLQFPDGIMSVRRLAERSLPLILFNSKKGY